VPLMRSESAGCVDCNQVCPAVCAEEQCSSTGARSCDGEQFCRCMCVCYACPLGVGKESAPVCFGTECPSCRIACQDECIRKRCEDLAESYPGEGTCEA
jgi:hypothetical protein